MELTLRLLGVGPGDEVITSAYTYTASASVIAHVGAKIVLVDSQKDSPEIDYTQLEQAITSKTKAIIPVDIAGIMCDYDKIFEIVERKKSMFVPNSKLQEEFGRVVVMADAAHSLGAKYKGKMSGSVADFSVFSFHAVKNLTTAEGGAVTWKSLPKTSCDEIYQDYLLYSLHGQTKDALSKNKPGAWEYDIVAPLYKNNMTDVHAAIGLSQLRRYNEMLEQREKLVKYYNKQLNDINGITYLDHPMGDTQSSYHLYFIRVDNYEEEDRNLLINKLAEHGISTNVHYKPLPLFSAYKNLGFNIKDYPKALEFYKNQITLPLHFYLTQEDIQFIYENLKRYVNV